MPDRSTWLLVIIPIVIPLLTGLVLWLIRDRSVRAQWIIAAIAGLLNWSVCLLYYPFLPIEASLSVWLPADIFATPVQLILNPNNWPLLVTIQSVLLAAAILQLSRPIRKESSVLIMAFLYISAASLAVTAGNILTIILVWTLFDISHFAFYYISQGKEWAIQRAIVNFEIHASATLLLLIASLILTDSVSDSANPPELLNSVGFLILIGTVLLRSGWYPTKLDIDEKHSIHIETMLRLIPLGVAIIPLFYFSSERAQLPLVMVISLVLAFGMIYMAIRWLFQEDRLPARPFFNFTFMFYGTLLWLMNGSESSGFIFTIVTGVLVGTVIGFGRMHDRLSGVLMFISGLFLLGMPYTSGGVNATTLASSVLEMRGYLIIIGLIVVAALSMIGLGIIRITIGDLAEQPGSDSTGQAIQIAALATPLISSSIFGILYPTGRSIEGLVIFVFTLVLTAGFYFAALRLSEEHYRRARARLTGRRADGITDALVVLVQGITRIIRAVGGIFEGEGAMLWLFVILAALAIAVGEG